MQEYDDKWLKQFKKGKNAEQVKVIEYFTEEGCLSGVMKDEQYLEMVNARAESLNLDSKSLSKLGIDIDEVLEISPVTFGGFVFTDEFYKRTDAGVVVSSRYEVARIYFSDTQIYYYKCSFNMDMDRELESTNEFFYKDVTSFSTGTELEKSRSDGMKEGVENKSVEKIQANKFCVTVPGDKLKVAMGEGQDAENVIQGMKQKLREKKNQ